MATAVGICNVALVTHLGLFPISSLSEDTKEARSCNAAFDVSAGATLEAHDWSFARRQTALAEASGVSFSGWEYAYGYPADCRKARRIYNPAGDKKPVPFDLRVNASLNAKYVVTDLEEAELIYTANVLNPAWFSDGFAEALSYRMASSLAIGLKGSVEESKLFLSLFQQRISDAETEDAREGSERDEFYSEFMEARG